jgi:hypothetical protein
MGDFQEALTALLGKDAPNLSPALRPSGGGRRGTRLLEGPGGRHWSLGFRVIGLGNVRLPSGTPLARSPKRVAPRIVGSPTLLTGIARCGTCGSGMTLRTGKSGRYRYYACAGCGQKGKTLCPGRSIGMGTLDEAVLGHLAERLFTPERLEIILSAYLPRSAEAGEARRAQLSQARRAHGSQGAAEPTAATRRTGPDGYF